MINVFNDIETLSKSAAALFVQTAQQAIESTGRFSVALTGGSSPIQLYRLLTEQPYAEQIDWTNVYVFWGDERWVPLTDDKSNAKMAFETLLTHVPIPEDHIFPMWTADTSPESYALAYEKLLRGHFGNNPQFDLILLGMGEDGHTASLFPHTTVLKEENKWVDAYYLEPQQMYRITLTAPLINQAKKIAFITYGKAKEKALYEVLHGKPNPSQYPSQLIRPPHGEVYWFVDEAAAASITT